MFLDALLVAPVGEEGVEELDAEHLYLAQWLEGAHVDVRALSDVQEDAVQEEQEGLDVQVLTPRQAQIEEELREPFVVDQVRLVRGVEWSGLRRRLVFVSLSVVSLRICILLVLLLVNLLKLVPSAL